jgi:ribose/xylose/arabinose/galactoside ABC-type transport system permease subunit
METRNRGAFSFIARIIQSPQMGLLIVIFALGLALMAFSGSYKDPATGHMVNKFLNPNTLLQIAIQASFFAIMAVGMTMVIITCGIDLSVGSIYALCGVTMAMVMRKLNVQDSMPGYVTVLLGLIICLGVGVSCGALNGLLVVGFKVHPFIITLGTMLVLRGIAFVSSKAVSIKVPLALTNAVKSPLFLPKTLSPVPMVMMVIIAVVGALYLQKTVAGRHIFAVGGNVEASRYAGLRINKVLVSVYTILGLCAGIAAFLGSSYYGAAACGDATGYEMYVIASAVVGGASLTGGKGNALNAMLGAILITLIRQSISLLHFDQNYEQIIIGCSIVIAVVLDQTSARISAQRLARAGSAAEKPDVEESKEK